MRVGAVRVLEKAMKPPVDTPIVVEQFGDGYRLNGEPIDDARLEELTKDMNLRGTPEVIEIDLR